MKDIFGTDPSKLIAIFGPGISKNHYEVGEDVASLFGRYVEKRNNKFFLDLYAFNKDKLLNVGVLPSNITRPPACTYERDDLFYSYRRDRKIIGEMWALLRIK